MTADGLKIVSGGQSGADRAALDWAIANGIPHGGWCPKGRKAQDGRIKSRYALIETPKRSYIQRTEWNVRDSDATVIFVLNPILRGGNRKTLEFARKYRKPCLVISKSVASANPSRLLRQFIEQYGVRVLNIAGSRASMEPQVAEFVQTVLDGVKGRIRSTPSRRHSSGRMSNPPPHLVAVVGGSGSGKTWLVENLLRDFSPNAVRLSLDDFYRDRSHLSQTRRGKINFDHPRAIDWQRFETVLRELRAGQAALVPVYDFATHSRLSQTKVIHPKPLIFVDGLWLLHRPSVRRLFSYSIFLECSTRTRLRRRLERDLRSRGRTVESIHQQFWRTVEPMHRRYVAPQFRWADLVLRRTCRLADLRSICKRVAGSKARWASGTDHSGQHRTLLVTR